MIRQLIFYDVLTLFLKYTSLLYTLKEFWRDLSVFPFSWQIILSIQDFLIFFINMKLWCDIFFFFIILIYTQNMYNRNISIYQSIIFKVISYIIGLCMSKCHNLMKNLCDVAYFSCEVAALPFQAHAYYGANPV